MKKLKLVLKYFGILKSKEESRFTKDNKQFKSYVIGDYTYGKPKVLDWNDGATLTIGKFTSIASNVTILLGGEHNYNSISTYPFESITHKNKQPSIDRKSKGNVIIGNDVWIGCNVTILSGVQIGDGAVVGAGSVVVKDVPPFGIYVGNSGITKKFRFSLDKINTILSISWWNWPINEILANKSLLMSDNFEKLREILTSSKIRNN